jgi:endoglucanase
MSALKPHRKGWVALFLALAAAFLGWRGQGPAPGPAFDHGAAVRADRGRKEIALVFTGHEFADGGEHIAGVLKKRHAPAGFFFTGDFFRSRDNAPLIERLRRDGHYLGPHSDKHLLYCSWENRQTLLVTKDEFVSDILRNYQAMSVFGVDRSEAPWFIPPYEWYNEAIVAWAKELGLVLFNFSPGTASNADYTTPDMPNYRNSGEILEGIFNYEKTDPRGLQGFILLLHIGTHPDRKDKFYFRLDELVVGLQQRGYGFVRIDQLLSGEKKP